MNIITNVPMFLRILEEKGENFFRKSRDIFAF